MVEKGQTESAKVVLVTELSAVPLRQYQSVTSSSLLPGAVQY